MKKKLAFYSSILVACTTPYKIESYMKKHFTHLATESQNKMGYLLVVCGSMCSGKTEEFIRIMSRLIRAGKTTVAIFKPSIDKRILQTNDKDPNKYVTSRNGSAIECVPVSSVAEILSYVEFHNTQVVGIDEAQFLPKELLIPAIKELVAQGKQIVISGLDLDFRAEAFGPMAELLAFADEIIKLSAICSSCGQDTYCITQRLINGIPAHYNDPIVMIGEIGYEPRCRACHIIRKD